LCLRVLCRHLPHHHREIGALFFQLRSRLRLKSTQRLRFGVSLELRCDSATTPVFGARMMGERNLQHYY
jgi:hypothetical protein